MFTVSVPTVSLVGAISTQGVAEESVRLLFFDERFGKARSLASRLDPAASPIPVRGDVTEIWSGGLNRLSRERPHLLQGVTTQSFLFCLRILIEPRATARASVWRLDKDLYAWVIETRPDSRKG